MNKMKLELLPINPLRGFEDPTEAHYKNSYKIQVEIAGETVSYVVCPKTFMNNHGRGSRVGFNEGERIYLPKDQNPALAPFFALYFHYSNLQENELESRFGKGLLKDLNPTEINGIILGTVLDLAKDVLRPEEMGDMIKRVKKDDQLYLQGKEDIIQEVVSAYLPATTSTQALAKREEQSLEYYTERFTERIGAHANNKHIRRSKYLDGARQLFGGGRDIFNKAGIVSSVPAGKRVLDNELFRNNLPTIVEYIKQFENIQKGTRVKLSREESRLIYEILDGAMETRRRPAYKMVDGSSPGENYLEATGDTAKFMGSLRMFLLENVVEDHQNAQKQLTELSGVVQRVRDEKDLASRVHDVLRTVNLLPDQNIGYDRNQLTPEATTNAVIPYNGRVDLALEEITEDLVEEERHLAEVLTAAPENSQSLRKAIQAQKLLKNLGISTTEVDDRITQINSGRRASVQSTNLPKLA
ncbi:hypothetical protein HOA91_03755 [Candidatus Woesearchaeota archaeon]|nr:hypothetical protein [Candidatus Woesearchaeota archaeon]